MRAPKFKIGDRVRVKSWPDMPDDMKSEFSVDTYKEGCIGFIKSIDSIIDSTQSYYVGFSDNIFDTLWLFEPEIELVVAVGQQLLFSFIKE